METSQDLPPVEDRELRADELRTELLPELTGSVFHVTTRSALGGIERDGVIRHNRAGDLGDSFPQQSINSYARRKGYVCLFDLRSIPDDELDWALTNLYFLNPSHTENRPVFLIVDPAAYEHLIPWTEAEPGAMLVPHAEAWYPSDLPLSLIRRILRANVLTNPPSDFLRALRQANGLG